MGVVVETDETGICELLLRRQYEMLWKLKSPLSSLFSLIGLPKVA